MDSPPMKRGVKRRRRGQQQRIANQREAMVKESAAHALLMALIAQGIMSGVLAHKIAVACKTDLEACKEGFTFPELYKLANLQQGRNLIRSVHTALAKSTMVPEPMKVPMPYTTGIGEAHFLLPHEYFACMYEDSQQWKSKILPQEEQLEAFWNAFEHHPTLTGHPIKKKQHWKRTVLPLLLHGDEVPVTGIGKVWSRSVLSFSWMSMLCSALGGKGKDLTFYITGVFEKFATPSTEHCLGTMGTMWSVMLWTFQALWDGVWPSTDWRGIAFPADTVQGRRAGQRLAGKYSACLLQLCGDLDYNAKWLGTPNWSIHSGPCVQCRTTFAGINSWQDNRQTSGWQRTLLSAASWRSQWTTKCLLFGLPGMNCWSIAYDLMHNLYLGWLQHFFGSAFYLLTHECLHEEPLSNLKVVEETIGAIQRRDPTRARYRQRLSKLSMFMKSSGFPKLKGRAADIRGLDWALLNTWQQFMDVAVEQHLWVEAFLKLTVEINELMNTFSPRSGCMSIPEPHCSVLFQKGCQMAQVHVLLSEHYAATGVQIFNCTTKMHFTLHTLELSKHCHPYLTWCFKGEANMKAVQQLWKSCVSGNKHFAVGRVAAIKQRHLVAINTGL